MLLVLISINVFTLFDSSGTVFVLCLYVFLLILFLLNYGFHFPWILNNWCHIWCIFSTSVELESDNVCMYICMSVRSLETSKMMGFCWNFAILQLGLQIIWKWLKLRPVWYARSRVLHIMRIFTKVFNVMLVLLS